MPRTVDPWPPADTPYRTVFVCPTGIVHAAVPDVRINATDFFRPSCDLLGSMWRLTTSQAPVSCIACLSAPCR